MNTTLVVKLPHCDFNYIDDETICSTNYFGRAEYDFKTVNGSWANGCRNHYVKYRLYQDLGTGQGQKLEALSDPID